MLQINENSYITSDLHFFHSNICRLCNRPYKTGSNDDLENPELLRMNEDILKLFDDLPESCEVWNLGDVFFAGRNSDIFVYEKRDELKDIISRMKGPSDSRKLYLILGNHDKLKYKRNTIAQFYEWLGFDKVYDTPILVNDKYILSHEPIYLEKESRLHNIYGHTHEKVIDKDYFKYDWDAYFALCKAAKRDGKQEPEMKVLYPDREIDLRHYHNVCYDNLHIIPKFNSIIGKNLTEKK